jgi:2-keto-4-pentenoate hydratase
VAPDRLAAELIDANAHHRLPPPPSEREGGFDLATAYAVEAEIARRRIAEGHQPVGLKVGFANKAAWRILKLETVVWAHMYDDTVAYVTNDTATLPLASMVAPKIEPEIVFGSRARQRCTLTESQPLGAGESWTARVEGLDLPPLTLRTS